MVTVRAFQLTGCISLLVTKSVEKLHYITTVLHLAITNLDDSAEGQANQAALAEGYQGFISCNVHKPSGPEWQTFAEAVVSKFSSFDSSAPALTPDKVPAISSFPVIHKVGNVVNFVLLHSEG